MFALIPRIMEDHIQWPDVCYCPQHGPNLHTLKVDCASQSDDATDGVGWQCSCPDNKHYIGCPFEYCSIAQCHPLCSLVTQDGEENYCHCPCHG